MLQIPLVKIHTTHAIIMWQWTNALKQ